MNRNFTPFALLAANVNGYVALVVAIRNRCVLDRVRILLRKCRPERRL